MDQFSNDYLFCDLCSNRPLFTDRDALNSHCYIVHGNIVGVSAVILIMRGKYYFSVLTLKYQL